MCPAVSWNVNNYLSHFNSPNAPSAIHMRRTSEFLRALGKENNIILKNDSRIK